MSFLADCRLPLPTQSGRADNEESALRGVDMELSNVRRAASPT